LVLRLFETFFRRWWLYLVPVVLLAGLGVMKVSGAKDNFRSVGTVNVASTTLTSSLSDVRGNPDYGWDTPASATSKQLNALLGTEQFVSSVASAAGLDDEVSSGLITLDEIRVSVYSWATSSNLMKVSASSADPSIAPALARATIEQFIQLVIDSEVSDSTSAESFYAELADSYEDDVSTARQEFDRFVTAHPAPLPPLTRPEHEQIEFNRLSALLSQAEGRYNNALDKSLGARLSIQQSMADVSQRLRMLDSPDGAYKEGKLKKAVLTFGTFVAIGLLLAMASVLLGTLLDHSVRTASDVQQRLGLRVLAIVPDGGSVLAPATAGATRRATRTRTATRRVSQPAKASAREATPDGLELGSTPA
jgi:capsular polysaccharide biosynthesis protein